MRNILKLFLLGVALAALSACDRFGGGASQAAWQELEQEVITADEYE